ncbi:30S ribosomal protein S8 [Striga asiatica]|uniref:30S ribosomal protein S8 n=1 Tax=Striga asiatica TaxID=4170 RepID=A0A5A7R069_STRAF|nr:30S ribosomal protein S8 [Striga asiatica]
MKAGILMRALLCKIKCPFICFCKPSAAHHLYSQRPLKLDNNPHVVVPSTTEQFAVPNVLEKSSSDEGLKVNGEQQVENTVLKSCLKKFPNEPDATTEAVKRSVKWIDSSGQELAEIKEFESSETGDTDTEDESSRCLCVIL